MLEMLDTVLWFGEVNIFLVLAIAIVGFVTLSWMMGKWWASKVQTTDDSDMQATKKSGKQDTNQQEFEGVLDAGNLSSELIAVVDWYKLGLNLCLPKHELDKIQQDYQGNDDKGWRCWINGCNVHQMLHGEMW